MRKLIIFTICIFFLCGCESVDDLTDSPTESMVENKTTIEAGITTEAAIVTQKAEIQTGYKVVTEKMYERTHFIIRELEYPQLSGEGDLYDEINDLIKATVIEFNSPDWEMDDDPGYLSFTGKYEIISQTEDFISIEFTSMFYAEKMAHPCNSCRGLTIDLKTGEAVTLDRYISSIDYILEQIDAKDYVLGYGVFQAMTEDEIKTEIKERFNDNELNTYSDNFCIDEEGIHIIVDDIIGSYYTIIKIPFDSKEN